MDHQTGDVDQGCDKRRAPGARSGTKLAGVRASNCRENDAPSFRCKNSKPSTRSGRESAGQASYKAVAVSLFWAMALLLL